MGVISIEKADQLYWLGRYTERVFTTLNSFFKYYDQMIDRNDDAYKQYCEQIAIPDIYKDSDDFIKRYLRDRADVNSVYSNLLRAFDNAVIMRDEISSTTLAYLQMALDCLKNNKNSSSPLYDLQDVVDYIYAFWGSADDCVEDEDCRNIMKCGKYMERLNLYIRLGESLKLVEKEFSKLLNRLNKIKVPYKEEAVNQLAELIQKKEDWKLHKEEAVELLETVLHL